MLTCRFIYRSVSLLAAAWGNIDTLETLLEFEAFENLIDSGEADLNDTPLCEVQRGRGWGGGVKYFEPCACSHGADPSPAPG